MEKYTLSLESIENACNRIEEYFTDEGVERREILRFRLMAEETMLKYRDFAGEDVEMELHCTRRFLKSCVQLEVFCKKMDPFQEDGNGIMKSLMNTPIENNHVWRFISNSFDWLPGREDRNIVTFSAVRRSRLSSPVKILICLAVGIIAAMLTRLLLTPAQAENIALNYVWPIANAYSGMLGVMAILLIFFSIPLCMVQYGSKGSFRAGTKKLLKTFGIVIIACAILTLAAALCFLKFSEGSVDLNAFFKPILDVFVGFIPTNIVGPFLNFNCMQVMVIGIMFGTAFIVMGDGADSIVNAFDKCNFVAVIVNGYLAKFVGIYTGLMIYYIIVTENHSIEGLLWVLLVTVCACVLGCIVMIAIISIKFGIAPRHFVKKLLPSFMINLFSGSVSASFVVFFNELVNDCGVDVRYNGVALNLGTVMFKPMYTVFLAATGFLLAANAGTLSAVTAVQIIILSVVLPAAIPNIQGGAASIIILLLASIGIGETNADMAVSLNSLLQFIIIPVNVFMLQCVVILEANAADMLDRSKLEA